MKLTITEKHLDRALSVPWSTRTCVLARAATAAGIEHAGCGTGSIDVLQGEELTTGYLCPEAREFQDLFDAGWGSAGLKDQRALDDLRAKLPVTIELTPVV